VYCPRCGVDNREHAQFCEKCGFNLPVAASAPGQQIYAPPQQTYSQQQPMPPGSGVMRGEPNPVVIDSSGRKYALNKNPTVAVILSFLLSGLGQLYNGDFKKFFLVWGVCIVVILIAVATGGVASFLLLGVWIWSMFDAYKVASRQSPLM
jgi:TM2 domain-containing membrane protein YozV